MDLVQKTWDAYEKAWEWRDRRVDDYLLMKSVLPTLFLCLGYVYISTKWGPRYMKDRPPFEIRSFIIIYNALQVVLSAYLFLGFAPYWFGGKFNWFCQPMDYSNSYDGLYFLHLAYICFFSKFLDFIDTFCFIARRKFDHISLLHVFHHGIMPLSLWFGTRWVGGGHASFAAMINAFVHTIMYTYYMVAALGPEYKKYIWWKKHLTKLQLVQFVTIMVHEFQLLFYDACDFPWQYPIYIGVHVIIFSSSLHNFMLGSTSARSKKMHLRRLIQVVVVKTISFNSLHICCD